MKLLVFCCVFLSISHHTAGSDTISNLVESQAQLLNKLYERNKPDVLLNDAQEIVYGGLHEMRAKIDMSSDFWSKFDGSVQVFFRNHRRNPERIGEDFGKFVANFQKKNKGLLDGKFAYVFDSGISDIEGKLKEYFADRPGLKVMLSRYISGAAYGLPVLLARFG